MTAPTTAADTAPAGDAGTTATGTGTGPAPTTATGTTAADTAGTETTTRTTTRRETGRTASRGDEAPRDPDTAGKGDDTAAKAGTAAKGDAAGAAGKGDGKGDATTDDGDDKAGDAAKDWRVEDLPAGAQKMIAELRKENGTRRAEAAEQKKAADAATKKAVLSDEKFASAVEAFTRAIGLTPEPDEPERSPEERIGELASSLKHTKVELAVYRSAAKHGGDPDALLDSRGFLTKAFALDPGADDFDKAIGDAIGAAVAANPKLRTVAPEKPVKTAVPSGGDFGGGPAGSTGPDNWSVDDFRREINKK